jgi:cytochrome b
MTPPSPLARPTEVATRVWDLPTRLFHWLLAAMVVGAFISREGGWPLAAMALRFRVRRPGAAGVQVALGLVGGRYARFSSFLFGPRRTLRQLRGGNAEPEVPGHSPLGALSVFALLGTLTFQAASGLFANDDIASEGPLTPLVSRATSDLLTTWHRLDQKVILGLAILHLAAVLYYRLRKRRDLIGPMLTGDKTLAPGTPASRDDLRSRLLALALFALCAAGVWWVVSVLGGGLSRESVLGRPPHGRGLQTRRPVERGPRARPIAARLAAPYSLRKLSWQPLQVLPTSPKAVLNAASLPARAAAAKSATALIIDSWAAVNLAASDQISGRARVSPLSVPAPKAAHGAWPSSRRSPRRQPPPGR